MKKILFIMTGGTIASVNKGNGLEPVEDNFFHPIVEQFHCNVDFEQLFNLDSSQIAPSHWLAIAGLINDKLDDYDGVVITHGTDTMAYTAAGLHFLLRNIPIPVVLTGSQIPLNNAGSDGRSNVELALKTAMSGLKGVLLAFGGKIMRGFACSKTYSDKVSGFESINEPYVSLMDTDEVKGSFSFHQMEPYKVFLLKAVPGLEPSIIEKIVSFGFQRIVIEGYGKGGLPEEFAPVIHQMVEKGVRVGITSQCTYEGTDCYIYKVGRELLAAGVHDYKTRTTEYAVADMMFRV